MFGYCNRDTHFPGEGGQSPFYSVFYTSFPENSVCVCVCVSWSKYFCKDLSWGFVLCVYVQYVYMCHIKVLFSKVIAFSFMCAK